MPSNMLTPTAAPSETIKAQIRELLMSVASLQTHNGRQALIQSASFDPLLIAQLDADQALVTFVPNTVATLANYGILENGRHALEALLTAARPLQGQEFQQQCDAVLAAWLGRMPESANAAPPATPSIRLNALKRQALEQQFAHYEKQYHAVSQQLVSDLNAMHQIPLQNQRDQLAQKMQEAVSIITSISRLMMRCAKLSRPTFASITPLRRQRRWSTPRSAVFNNCARVNYIKTPAPANSWIG